MLRNFVQKTAKIFCFPCASNDSGFSLIEVAGAMIIFGLVAVPMVEIARIEHIKDSVNGTRGDIANIQSMINQNYNVAGLGTYVCPASLIAKEGDADFGVSRDCNPAQLKLCSDPTWDDVQGVCKTGTGAADSVIGAVPFATLKIAQDEALDKWGNKLLYVVSFSKTDPARFSLESGYIDVRVMDDPKATDGIPDPYGSKAEYMLISMGPTGRGGYSKDGVLISKCPAKKDGLEFENCNMDNVFLSDTNPDIESRAAFSTVAGDKYYDDVTRFQTSLPEAAWFKHPKYNSYMVTLATRVGIGTNKPGQSLQVEDDISVSPDKAFNGNLKTNTVCNLADNKADLLSNKDCMPVKLITQGSPSLKCTEDYGVGIDLPVLKIGKNQTYCGSGLDQSLQPLSSRTLDFKFSIGLKDATCAGNSRAIGIDKSGNVICGSL